MPLPTWLGGRRPPRWLRIISAAIAVLFAVGLSNAHALTDVFGGSLSCSFMLLNAIASKGLYDGRFSAWTRKHPIANGSLIFLVLGGCLLLLLSDHIAAWLAAVIVVPPSATFAVWVTYRDHCCSVDR